MALLGIAAAIPLLVLVMTTTVDGTTKVDPKTGVEMVVEREEFTNAWQVVESVSGGSSGNSSDIMGMCNINMLFFLSVMCRFAP